MKYKKLPEEKQFSLVDFCPHLIYYIIEGTDSPKPLKCRIDVKGAKKSCGKPVYFMLTPPGFVTFDMHVYQDAINKQTIYYKETLLLMFTLEYLRYVTYTPLLLLLVQRYKLMQDSHPP